MHSRRWILLVALLLLAPTAAAFHKDGKPKENPNEKGGKHHHPPASFVVVGDRHVGAGEVANWSDRAFKFTGKVTVGAGGVAIVSNATSVFTSSSSGFHVHAGGTLRILDTTLSPENLGSQYKVFADPQSHLRLDGAHLLGGQGASIATDLAIVKGNTFEAIGQALHLLQTNVTIENNTFLGNGVGVNQTGGFPVLRNNRFEGGTYCIRDWLSDPTIIGNTLIGCSYGIWHERSESLILDNTLVDKADPPGTGISITDTMSPIIGGNDISNWGTGILIRNARGYLRENHVHGNVLDGIRIEGNSAPMDITGNAIHDNGRDGVRLVGAWEIPVASNVIERNGGHGVLVENGRDVTLLSNTIANNGLDGIRLASGTGLVAEDNHVASNLGSGLLVEATVTSARLSKNVAAANAGDGFSIAGTGVILETGEALENAGSGYVFEDSTVVHAYSPVATGNGGAGFNVARVGHLLLDRPVAVGNLDGFAVSAGGRELALVKPRGLDNLRDGLRNLAGDAPALHGWWEGNGEFGVRNLDATTSVDARHGYWGSSTGPRHALNPLGTGDRVSDGVQFLPYATSAPT